VSWAANGTMLRHHGVIRIPPGVEHATYNSRLKPGLLDDHHAAERRVRQARRRAIITQLL
jgi:hypothetical protein